MLLITACLHFWVTCATQGSRNSVINLSKGFCFEVAPGPGFGNNSRSPRNCVHTHFSKQFQLLRVRNGLWLRINEKLSLSLSLPLSPSRERFTSGSKLRNNRIKSSGSLANLHQISVIGQNGFMVRERGAKGECERSVIWSQRNYMYRVYTGVEVRFFKYRDTLWTVVYYHTFDRRLAFPWGTRPIQGCRRESGKWSWLWRHSAHCFLAKSAACN